MKCSEFEEQLDRFLDGEQEAAISRRLQAHESSCPRCAARRQAESRLRSMIRQGMERAVLVPTGLGEEVLAEIGLVPERGRGRGSDAAGRPRLQLPGWALNVLAAAALLFVAFGLLVLPWSGEAPVAFAELARTAATAHRTHQRDLDPHRLLGSEEARDALRGLPFVACVPRLERFELHLASTPQIDRYGRSAILCFSCPEGHLSHIDMPSVEVDWESADKVERGGTTFYCRRVEGLEVVCLPVGHEKICITVTDLPRARAIEAFARAISRSH